MRPRVALLVALAAGIAGLAGQSRAPAAQALAVSAHCDTALGRDGCNHWYRAP